MENVKDWLKKKGYYNIGLRTDRNNRVDLYLSDVINEYIIDNQKQEHEKFIKWYVKDETLRNEPERITDIVDRYLKEINSKT